MSDADADALANAVYNVDFSIWPLPSLSTLNPRSEKHGMPLSDWQGYASWQLNSAITGGGISQITDPLGRTVTYQYEPPTGGYAASRLHRVTNPAHGVTTYGYAGPYNIGSITDARGITYLTNTYCTSGGGIVCPPDPVSRPAVRRAVVRRFRDRFPAQSCLSAVS